MKVLVAERIAEDGIGILKKDFDVDVRIGLSPAELAGIIHEYDGIVVRSATKVTAELLEKAASLKVAGRAGTGVDNIDVPAATRKGVVVVNTPDGNSMAAAELAVGLAYSVFRNIPQAYANIKNNDYRRNKIKGFELNGKVAGIVGLGRIGGLVAERLKASNMRVIAYDPYVSDERYKSLGAKKCETLDELLAEADLITIHMAKTEQTTNMFDAPQFAKMKKGVRIVNAARGGIINEKALYDALADGTVAGTALDVLQKEPNFELPPDRQDYKNPLLELDNVIYVPHLGASTQEAQYNVGVQIAVQVAAVLKGEMVPAVNTPSISSAQLAELRPYIDLAEKLGSIYFQAQAGALRKIDVKCSGDLLEKDTRVITLAALKGLMTPILEDNVNFVNAETLATARGITVSETRDANLEKYTNLITLTFTTDEKTESISGTVFAKEEIRMVDFFGYKLDFEPTPNVVAIQNIDKPGVIGKIGTVLGNAGYNIAAMQWSRNRKGEKAVAFVSVDSLITDEALDTLRKLEGVLKVSKLAL
ncbi:MAG: phosphoglycerate dehydrogenase [Clostridiales bacterium]|jgi:D-3-phosphoglycerate dehydrogenase|nr:phosphoglycerate dehydrogenase [Clostridiales bacterium]